MKILLMLALLLPVSANALTVNLVSDIHAGSSTECVEYKCVPKWNSAFQEMLDKTDGIIISAGDNTDTGSKTYADKLKAMAGNREVYWAMGNHDGSLYLGSTNHFTINQDGWRIIVTKYDSKKCLSSKEYDWVKSKLKGYENKKVAIVSHIPVLKSDGKTVKSECKKVYDLYKKYKVDYVFSGHIHYSTWTTNKSGVIYKAIPGLTYNYKTNWITLSL